MITQADFQPFAQLLEAAQLAELISRDCNCEANRNNCRVTVKMGRKWARVDVGPSGKYMVDLATGEICFIKAYGVPHHGHRFGTLATINEWDWRGYMAKKITA